MTAPRDPSRSRVDWQRDADTKTPAWVLIAIALASLAVLVSCPFVCGACAGLADRGYDVGAGR